MQNELKNLVEAVRDGRGIEAALVAAQVQLLLANNPGKATAHDPATAGPDDLARRLVATVQACGDAAIAPSGYTWPEVESICKAVILAIGAVGDKRVPFVVVVDHESNCTCEHCCAPTGWTLLLINGKQYTLDEKARPKNDAEIAKLARTWGVSTADLNAALDRWPGANPKPVSPPTVLVPAATAWHDYPQDPPKIPGMYQVRLMSGEETWRKTEKGSVPCSFATALDTMNAVVAWLG